MANPNPNYFPVMIAEMGESAKLVMIFDAVIEESHSQTCDITEHPVEDGSVISDFVIQKPLELSLSVVKSNYPIKFFNDSQFANVDLSPFASVGQILTSVENTAIQLGDRQLNKNTLGTGYVGRRSTDSSAPASAITPPDFAIRAYETMSRLQRLAKPLRIYTGLKIYDYMVIQSISSKRNVGNAEAWEAEIQLKQVRIASVKYVEANTAKPGKAKNLNSKKKDNGPAKEEVYYVNDQILVEVYNGHMQGIVEGKYPLYVPESELKARGVK